jgi:large subunit ribosomal protein L24
VAVPSKLNICKGDKVMVISGADKGKGPVEVLEVLPKRGMVVVAGVNVRWKHIKPNQKSPKGGRIQTELPIHACKVLLYSDKASKGVRVRRAIKDGRRVRVGTCGTEFSAPALK